MLTLFLACNHVTRRSFWWCVGGQYNRAIPRRINMKIGFSSQRREMLLFLTLTHYQQGRSDVTCKPAIPDNFSCRHERKRNAFVFVNQGECSGDRCKTAILLYCFSLDFLILNSRRVNVFIICPVRPARNIVETHFSISCSNSLIIHTKIEKEIFNRSMRVWKSDDYLLSFASLIPISKIILFEK